MSQPDDYPDEMRDPRPLDQRTIEALFAGRPLPDPQEALLVSFAQAVRAVSSRPPAEPRGELAAVLMSGLHTELAGLPAIRTPGRTPRRRRAHESRRRMTLSQLLSALAAKLGTLGLAAKAGFAAALTAAGVTAAAAGGALPAPVQNAVAHAVGDVTPFSFPATANPHASFGAKVSTQARTHHGVSGTSVSSAARKQGAAERSVTATASTGAPSNPGSQSSTGLSRAGSTPAAGHVPTSVPTPSNPGSQASTAGSRSGTAATTGAPSSPGSQSSTGLSRAGSTPAAGYVPTSVPVPSTAGSQATSNPGSSHH